MENKNKLTNSTSDREVVMTRMINAPREMVYKVWTDPEHVFRWWGPNGFTNTILEMSVRTGGVWRYIMHAPDGTDFANRIRYTEVVPHEKLVYEHDGDIENDPNSFHVVVTFEAVGAKTKVTMASMFASPEVLQMLIKEFGVLEGGMQTLNRLEAHLVCMAENAALTISREFEASRDLVFKVWTEPEHLARWWGPQDATVELSFFELKPGGMFHYLMKHPLFGEIWGKFIYREIIVPEKLVFVSAFSDEKGGFASNPWLPVWPAEVLNVVVLSENGNNTKLVLNAGPVNATEEEVAAFKGLSASMQEGFAGTFDKLNDYLRSINK